ncbi:primosomal replication protein N [Candidatus Kinetoplastibacterium desouzaii TCC079E]|uniref:Primosomal replication protein N n=1 Tax=Candidatus Kinetoplastidibacterium desouzai TCC079E TaxID=1208919 RepID=M1LMH1_9PROT|nr:primosomal replication protein N [Candidatus Kinetoplastibacterium desouzaii]AGF46927.1 primosomal replication protein N [Candidatus Kinetoplastibacterium desouzaii TCC079E]
MNVLNLSAMIISRNTIRYNHAGVPILEITLKSFSKVIEAGIERDVNLLINSIVVGDLTNVINKIPNDKEFCVSGFIALKYRNSMSLRFHLQRIINLSD